MNDARKLTDEQVAQVLAESNAYFHGSWFKEWFRWTQDLLEGSGCGSYRDGSACHLDLVQWATKPVQADLSSLVWETLVASDRNFLRWQLENCSLRVLLLNGRSVVDELKNAGIVKYDEEDELPYQTKSGPDELKVSRGQANGILVLGWNRPLHKALSTDGRVRLSEWVRRMVHAHAKAPVKRQAVPPVVRRRAPSS